MRLAHLHLPNITPFNTVSQIQQTLTLRQLAYKKAISSSTSTITPPDPTIITFTPNPVYTTGRRDLPPSNTSSPSDATPSLELSLPPSLEPIRHLLDPNQSSETTTTTNNEAGRRGLKAEYHPTLRGGQTTYHGPGQLVAYTILDLRRLGLSPRCHISLLEKSVIDLLAAYGVNGFTTSDPGVWVNPRDNDNTKDDDDGATKEARKITAVGVHLRRHISSFGIGLNVTQEPMWFFKQIVGCGLEGKEATSLKAQGVTFASDKTEAEVMREVADGFVDSFVRRLASDFPVGSGLRREGVESVYRIGVEDVV